MRVLIIDDEPRYMGSIVDELQESGHEVALVDNTYSARLVIGNTNANFDVVILDIAMPSAEPNTLSGLLTGFVLYREIRAARPSQKIVIFTNVPYSAEEANILEDDQATVRLFRKSEVLPFEFVEEVQNFVGPGPG
jgi:DNA-binding response OmpR family regulator